MIKDKRMRKLFLIFGFIFLLTISNLFAATYVVDTSRGEIEVAVPEGYTELEAFLEMSKLYLEERFDHEDLLKSVDDLKILQESYIQENRDLREKYDLLNIRSNNLISLYDDKLKQAQKADFLSSSFGISLNTGLDFSVDAGVVFIEKIQVSAVYTYPNLFGLRIGFIL